MSVASKARKTAWVIAWIVVALGLVTLLLGWRSYSSNSKAFDCAHAKLDSESLDKLFAPGYVADSDKWDEWDEWAAQHDASISWGAKSGLMSDTVVVDPGGIRADEVSVRGCDGLLTRERYALRPNVLQNAKVEFGVGAIAGALVALWVLRLTRKSPAVT